MREASVARKTNETDIQLTLALEGEHVPGGHRCGFLDQHAGAVCPPRRVRAAAALSGGHPGGLPPHGGGHRDCAGTAFREALGDKRGINRYGSFLLPMDEALVLVAVDLSGRTTCCCDLTLPAQRSGILTPSSRRNSSSASAAAGSSPSMSDSWRGRTPTTSSRRRSRGSAGRWRLRSRWTAVIPTRCRAPRACCERSIWEEETR